MLRFLAPKSCLQCNQESFLSPLIILPLPDWLSYSSKSEGGLSYLPPKIPTLLPRSGKQVLSGDTVALLEVRFLHQHIHQDPTPTENASTPGQLHSLMYFTLASIAAHDSCLWRMDYREFIRETLHQVVTYHYAIFLLNRRYKTRKLPDCLVRWKVTFQ